MPTLALEKLITSLHKMPTITKKQAEKIAYAIIEHDQEVAKNLAKEINDALSIIKPCSICGHLSEEEICEICQDQNRRKVLIVVENAWEVFKFERMTEFKPYYHVLNGLIKVSKNMNDNQNIDDSKLNIASLVKRANQFQEIVLALSPNLEGIVTANYLKQLLEDVKVTQLAQGIPLGAAMEYVDELTLKAALSNRKEIK